MLVVLVAAAAAAGCGSEAGDAGSGSADAQTIRFQQPEDPGPDPFTEPADIEGGAEVALPASGPYGGSGSDKVCDRDKLIRFLKANPDRMREWARVVGIRPKYEVVAKYIARLHPTTLTRDTQVTNHSFENGRAVGFQAILQAGTAVLVDDYGRPVARCRCGNPLKEPVYQPEAKCTGCPPNYSPPKQCRFYGRKVDYYRRSYTGDYYDNEQYDTTFIEASQSGPYKRCYEAYPDPPVVTVIQVYQVPQDRFQTEDTPEPPQEPGGINCANPQSQYEFEQCHPPEQEPQTTPEEPQTTEPECDVPHFRANGCADIMDRSTDPGIQP